MTVNWDEPKYDGGSPITGYFVEKKETTSKRWSRVSREPIRALPLGNSWDVTGLLEGSLYQFRIIAVNAAGCGLPSMPSDPILCRDPISKSQNVPVEPFCILSELKCFCIYRASRPTLSKGD